MVLIQQNNLPKVRKILRHFPESIEGCCSSPTVSVGTKKPLHLAASLGQIEMCKCLLEHTKMYEGRQVYNLKDEEGKTPIFCASSSEVVELFLEAGLENMETTLAGGYTLLHHCVEKIQVSQVSQKLTRLLREQWLRRDHGESPLNEALEYSSMGLGAKRLTLLNSNTLNPKEMNDALPQVSEVSEEADSSNSLKFDKVD